jgi:hypothetical protein
VNPTTLRDNGRLRREPRCSLRIYLTNGLQMLIWLTLGREFGASLILACVNTIVALALIALSLSIAIAVSLLADCATLQAKARASSMLGARRTIDPN